MLSAVLPGDFGLYFGIAISGISAFYVLRAKKGTANEDEAVTTATLMTSHIAALDSKVALLESDKRNQQTEITHLHTLRAEDAKTIERNAEDIVRLTELITQSAAVKQFRTESLAWFAVIAAALDAEPPSFPDHVPEPV